MLPYAAEGARPRAMVWLFWLFAAVAAAMEAKPLAPRPAASPIHRGARVVRHRDARRGRRWHGSGCLLLNKREPKLGELARASERPSAVLLVRLLARPMELA